MGGSNYPEAEECLEGLYAYDIGKSIAYSPSRGSQNWWWLHNYVCICASEVVMQVRK